MTRNKKKDLVSHQRVVTQSLGNSDVRYINVYVYVESNLHPDNCATLSVLFILVCNFMCHEKCLKILRSICSCLAPSLVHVSNKHREPFIDPPSTNH